MPPHSPVSVSCLQRACDHCRRKKARCDSIDSTCTRCRTAGHNCTFDIPPGKRGPKGKPRRRDIVNVQDDTSQRHYPIERASHSSSIASLRDPTVLDRCVLLADAIAHASSFATSLEPVIRECTDLFFSYIAPFNMSVHELTFRRLVNQAFETLPSGASLSASAFALITAVCAKVCFFLPSDLFALGNCLGETFLKASRSCLASYSDADLENPCADSITIRYLHSNCLHISARPKVAWYVFGEAVRLIMHMRLHDEYSYLSLPSVEAAMRRNAFWQVYIGDKSMGILRSMPITICDYAFDGGITAAYPSTDQNELVLGYNLGTQLWRSAADLLLQIRMAGKGQPSGPELSQPSLTPLDHRTLSELYVRFATCIDSLPAHLMPDSISISCDGSTTHNAFAVQIADLHVTYHCLKMHFTLALEKIGYFSYTGESVDMLVLRKTEVAESMVQLLQALPFWCLQVSGEPCVRERLPHNSLQPAKH
ncbi:hypothetical protein P170DRAFT_479927 [Aspergillus steynii IBT 23096]|uniref:Zn(2)-C6 fungal-type domain-containing protein n=1 Tax=Aspergillus steynii IBT 23096 TaxID=1392250 RepID=A0A2I2FUA9_9EURO|nr:uncharacterized protein P170DRAFT_479927 [Aspergillus steynii IBT 23096]PLB44156.1 hypothetical protein P170DRAFT_479927 [Aspergillus steynii IBT 23096]